jgi:hypothetical protein
VNPPFTVYPIVESNYANNCGGWQTLTVGPAIPATPASLTATCNANGTAATLSWSATPGATSYAVRMNYPVNDTASCTYGWVCSTPPDQLVDGYTSTSISYPTTPGYTYNAWVHAVNASGGSNPATLTFACSGAADLTAGAVTPTTATAGVARTLSATATNSGNVTSGSFPMLFQVSQTGALVNSSYIAGIAASGTGAASASYTIPSAGTYQVRACANNNTSWVNIVTESNYANNCGAWTDVVVTPAVIPTVSCTVSPASVPVGGSVTYTATPAGGAGSPYVWTAGDGGSYGSASTVTRTFAAAGTYAMNVTAASAPATAFCPNVGVAATWCTAATPSLSLTASASRVKVGQTVTLNWSASGINGQNATCTVTGPGVSWSSPVSAAPTCSVPNGSATPIITTQSTYTLTCGSQSTSVLVNVIPNFIPF